MELREIAGRRNVASSVVGCSALVDHRVRPGVESGPSSAKRQAFARLRDKGLPPAIVNTATSETEH